MPKVSFILTDHSVTYIANGDVHTVDTSSASFPRIKEILKQDDHDEDELASLASPAAAVAAAFEAMLATGYLAPGRITVTPTAVHYNGVEVHSVLTERILALLAEGFGIEPWVEFMSNLFTNPVDSARDELYEFLEKADLPITPDGHFLAYKIVDEDYKDLYTHSFDNSVGQTVEVPRESVDHDRRNLCSSGLHFCSKGYLPHYGTAQGNHVMIVKINPADVVSIPTDYDFAKGRTFKYVVVGEIERADALIRQWAPVTFDYDDDDYDETLDFESDPESPADEPVVDSPAAGRLTAGVLLNLRAQHGGSWNAVAKAFGVSTGTVSSWVEKLGLRGQ